jgi:hypothetical protein
MQKALQYSFIITFLLISFSTAAQNLTPEDGYAFRNDEVPRIDILIDSDSLALILEPGNEWSNHEYPATFIFTTTDNVDSVENIGLRLRGNTSRVSGKKSFKIAFNSFENGKFEGVEKFNVNGEHNDPGIIRSKLAWDLYREMEVPGSRANHVELYINNEYKGLYINVEHIDEEFVQNRFGNNNGNLYKCLWPADLNYIDNNPNSYKFEQGGRRTYNLKTNTAADDYSDLAHFINVINNTAISNLPEELEPIFNVDGYLRNLAVEVYTGHWDCYAVNKNNFYLYNNTASGQFEFIPYDPDNTYGIDWFGIDWALRDINNWSNNSEYRPLTERILQVPEYFARYNFYFSELITHFTNTLTYFPQIDDFKSNIAPYVVNDQYHSYDYGWDYDDFIDSYSQALSTNHVTYGLKPYIEARNGAATSQLQLSNISPVIRKVEGNHPGINQLVHVHAEIKDDISVASAKLFFQINSGNWDSIEIFDDGLHNDMYASDGVYANTFGPATQSGTVKYYLKAWDNTGKMSREPYVGMRTLNVFENAGIELFINEFMALNNNTISDNSGEYDDWIEIYNGGSSPVYLGDKYMSDRLNTPYKWNLPPINIQAGEFLLYWADGDTLQGEDHASFKLSSGGEELVLSWNDNGTLKIVDYIDFSGQSTDISEGRFPNGTGPSIELSEPTPGASNVYFAVEEVSPGLSLMVYPNPTTGIAFFEANAMIEIECDILVYDLFGRLVHKSVFTNQKESINLVDEAAGMYFVILSGQDELKNPLKASFKLIKK